VRRVEDSTDGGHTWKDAGIRGAVHPKAHTRFGMDWKGTGDNACYSRAAPMNLGRCNLRARNWPRFSRCRPTITRLTASRARTTRFSVAGSGRWERAQCDFVLR
jgi:hypothetical protein